MEAHIISRSLQPAEEPGIDTQMLPSSASEDKHQLDLLVFRFRATGSAQSNYVKMVPLLINFHISSVKRNK